MIPDSHERAWLKLDLTRRSMFPFCSSARAFIAFTMLWSVAELPCELEATPSGMATAALIFAKLLFIFIAALTFLNVKWASFVYIAICALSILAISPSLLLELKSLRIGFALSAVEVLAKAGCLLSMSGWLGKVSSAIHALRRTNDFRHPDHRSGNF
jgi:hypothetical protein